MQLWSWPGPLWSSEVHKWCLRNAAGLNGYPYKESSEIARVSDDCHSHHHHHDEEQSAQLALWLYPHSRINDR
jgi:hypothetical protein